MLNRDVKIWIEKYDYFSRKWIGAFFTRGVRFFIDGDLNSIFIFLFELVTHSNEIYCVYLVYRYIFKFKLFLKTYILFYYIIMNYYKL